MSHFVCQRPTKSRRQEGSAEVEGPIWNLWARDIECGAGTLENAGKPYRSEGRSCCLLAKRPSDVTA
ncbi:hypothetical protein GGTG_00318 [Gaeumannomyces tritici R3-111a-1]|uniref:Uncharacterized protein n=1 Tax=Gaeumannomyces tritici (strain R3-111a-1) TaxID=644352 RepID=J3NGC7_GAET3|nr:hypothetical protein GGTG_00318 [Gaeumannomyces tritici R3-111a-1]EJT80317.1 hypothetical protein GGTG_00318 [Gaeumannomyces tritici R3-111a-1]